jgi:hypothetical protein
VRLLVLSIAGFFASLRMTGTGVSSSEWPAVATDASLGLLGALTSFHIDGRLGTKH